MDNKTKVVLKIAIPVIFALAIIAVASFYLGANTATTYLSSGASQSGIHYGLITVSPVRQWDPATNSYKQPASILTEIAFTGHNMYTLEGRNATRDYLFHSGTSLVTAYNVISIGVENVSSVNASARCIGNTTGTSYGGCQDYAANGLQPAAGTVQDVSASNGATQLDPGNVSITKTFTCTSCSSTPINATGLYNDTTVSAAAGNNSNVGNLHMFAEANFTVATLQTNDQINVTWYIWTQ